MEHSTSLFRCVIATSNFPASIAHTTSEFPHRDEIYHQAHTTYYTPHWGSVKDPIFIRVWRRNKIQWLKRGTTCRDYVLAVDCRLRFALAVNIATSAQRRLMCFRLYFFDNKTSRRVRKKLREQCPYFSVRPARKCKLDQTNNAKKLSEQRVLC